MRLNTIDWIALFLVIIGAINWLLIGLFEIDLVSALLGGVRSQARIVYAILGLAGLWLIWTAYRLTEPPRPAQ